MSEEYTKIGRKNPLQISDENSDLGNSFDNFFNVESSKIEPETKVEIDLSDQQLGPYKIEKVIGSGGMGQVYKAYHPKLSRLVAIKVMLNKPMAERERQRFLEEARLTARLQHPNIIPIHEVGSEKGLDYIVMDFIDGVTLDKFLRQQKTTISKSLAIIQQLAKAIAYAHKEGVVHRDLKPSNIMVEKETKRLLIMDFGLAKDLKNSNKITKSGEVLGTPRYMSPEQASGKRKTINQLTDVYSLGAMLYEMLTGAPAVKGETPTNIVYNVLYQEITPPRKLNLRLSKEVENICLKAIEKEPVERYQSAKDLAQDIERFLNGESILACPPPLYYFLWKKLKRQKQTVIALIILLVLLLGFLTKWKWQKKAKIQQLSSKAKKLSQKAIWHKTIEDTLTKAEKMQAEKHLYTLTQSRSLLDQALALDPNNRFVEKHLYQVEKNIGILAAATGNYILSEISFKRCQVLGQPEEAKQHLKKLQKKRQKIAKEHLAKIEKLMANLKLTAINNELINEYAAIIVRLPGEHTTKKLIEFLQGNLQQRLVAIRSLGKLGDTRTKVEKKDVVAWLIQHVKRLQVTSAVQETHEVVWALGRLADPKAKKIILQTRNKMGTKSEFWASTKIPYSMVIDSKLQNAQDYNQRGLHYYYRGEFTKAISDFNQAIKLKPDFADVYNNKGLAHEACQEIQKAIEDYMVAVNIDQHFVDAYSNLLRTYGRHNNMKKMHKHIKQVAKAIDRGPMSAIIQKHQHVYLTAASKYLEQGKILLNAGKLDQAIEKFTKSIHSYSTATNSFVYRAKAYAIQGKIKKAIKDYSQAIGISPKNSFPYKQRGLLLAKSKNYSKAILDLRKYLKLVPYAKDALEIRSLIDKYQKNS